MTTTEIMSAADQSLRHCLTRRTRNTSRLIPAVAPETPRLVAQHAVEAAARDAAAGREVDAHTWALILDEANRSQR